MPFLRLFPGPRIPIPTCCWVNGYSFYRPQIYLYLSLCKASLIFPTPHYTWYFSSTTYIVYNAVRAFSTFTMSSLTHLSPVIVMSTSRTKLLIFPFPVYSNFRYISTEYILVGWINEQMRKWISVFFWQDLFVIIPSITSSALPKKHTSVVFDDNFPLTIIFTEQSALFSSINIFFFLLSAWNFLHWSKFNEEEPTNNMPSF